MMVLSRQSLCTPATYPRSPQLLVFSPASVSAGGSLVQWKGHEPDRSGQFLPLHSQACALEFGQFRLMFLSLCFLVPTWRRIIPPGRVSSSSVR